jgi:hypothetical protein
MHLRNLCVRIDMIESIRPSMSKTFTIYVRRLFSSRAQDHFRVDYVVSNPDIRSCPSLGPCALGGRERRPLHIAHRRSYLNPALSALLAASLLDETRQSHTVPLGHCLLPPAQPVHRRGKRVTARNDEAADEEYEDDVEDVVGRVVAALGDLCVAHPSVVSDCWRDEGIVLRVFVAGDELSGKISLELYMRNVKTYRMAVCVVTRIVANQLCISRIH